MGGWFGRDFAVLIFSGLTAVLVLMLVVPPRDYRGDCLRAGCVRPVDRATQAAMIAVVIALLIGLIGAWFAARRHRSIENDLRRAPTG